MRVPKQSSMLGFDLTLPITRESLDFGLTVLIIRESNIVLYYQLKGKT